MSPARIGPSINDNSEQDADGRRATIGLLPMVRTKVRLLKEWLTSHDWLRSPPDGQSHRVWFRYGLAVVIITLALLLRWSLPGVLAGTPYLAFYPAVVAAAVLAGRGPGILATIGSLLCVDLLFDTTPGYIHFNDPVVLARAAIFLIGGIGVSILAGMQSAAHAQQRKQADELASVAQFASENPHPVLRVGGEGQVLYANKAAEELLEHEGWTRSKTIPTELRAAASLVLRDGTEHESGFTCRSQRTFMFLCVPVVEKGYVNFYGRDVTDARRAEVALRQSEDRYRGLVQASAAAVWTADITGRITKDSPSWRAFTGQTLDQFLGYGWLQAIHPEDRARAEADWRVALARVQTYQTEYRLWHQGSGAYRYTIARGVRVLNEDGSTREWVGMNIDITELRRAEAEQSRLAAIVETSHDAILSKNLDGIIQTWNAAAEQVFGYRAEEIIGQPISLLFPTERRDELDHILSRLRRGDRIEDHETVRMTKDGRRLDVSVSIAPIRDHAGQMIGASTITRDISARKAMEESLRRSEQRFRSFVEATTQIVWTTNPRGEVDMAIPSWQAYTGQTEEEARGFGWMDAIREEDRPRVAEAWQKAFETSGLYEVEYLLRVHDGSRRSILARGVPVRNPDGSVREYIGVCIDVTAQKQAEEAVQKSQQQFRTLADAIPQLAWMANADGWIHWYNQRWYEYTGTTPEEMEGWGWQSVHDPQVLPAVLQQWQASIATGQPFDMTFPLRGADGVFRPFLTRIMPLKDEQGEIVQWFGTNTDITEQRQTEMALRKSEERLALAASGARIGMFEWNVATGDVVCTEQLARLVGIETTTAATTTTLSVACYYADWAERVHPDDLPRVEAEIRRCISESLPFEAEYRVVWTDRSEHWLVTRGYFERGAEGHQMLGIVMDITERMKAEAEREQQHQLMRRLVEVSKYVVGEKSLSGLLQTVADAARELTGARVASSGHGYVGGTFIVGAASRDEAFPPCPPGQTFAIDKGGVYMDLIEKVDSLRLTDEEMRNHVAWWGLPQDHVPMCGLLGVKLVDAQGKANGTIMVSCRREGEFTEQDEAILKQLGAVTSLALQHVEAREQAEERTKEVALSEERLRMAQQVARVGTFEWNIQSGINTWSPELEKMYGLTPGGFAGTQAAWEQLVHPEDRAEAVRRIEQAMKTGEFEAEWRAIWPDGTVHWLFGRASVLRDESGQPLRLIGVNIDITERKQAEEAIQESEERFRTLADATPVLIWQCNSDRSCDYFNRSWLEFTGRTLDEESGSGWAEGVHPEDRQRALKVFASAAEQREPFEMEYRLRHHTGEYRWIFDRGVPRLTSDGLLLGYIGGCIDITDRKQAEEALAAAKDSAERAKAVAEQANRAKDHFLAVLSHELRTPLTPVVMGVSMLQDRADLDTGVRESLDMIRRNVEMEARLIDDLLDVSRIARGKVELNRSPVPLCTILHQAVEVCRPDIEARKLHFGIDIGPSAPYWINADASRLQQVFWNLLKNAIKFTPNDGCIGIRCRPNQDYVLIEVNDSGIGIESEALSRVFDAFEQSERSITRQFGGLGLGLAISKALVELHGGQISAHSEGRNKGATFRIRLPLATPAGQPELPSAPAVSPPRVVGPLRVLLVEDHGVTAKMMKMVLTAEGHTVETAGDVAAALEQASQNHFDLLMSDLGLPDGSGHDLMRQLRERGCQFPGIALSGYGQEEDIRRSHEAGFAAHLTKPASRESLIAAIASVVTGQAGFANAPDEAVSS